MYLAWVELGSKRRNYSFSKPLSILVTLFQCRETPSNWSFFFIVVVHYIRKLHQYLKQWCGSNSFQSCLYSRNHVWTQLEAPIQLVYSVLLHLYNRARHWGIRCLTLYFDVSWYCVMGLSAMPHVPTPTFPFTLSGEAKMLRLTCKQRVHS